MEFVKTLKDDNNNAVAFATRKQHKLSLEDRMDRMDEKLDLILKRLDDHEQLFRQHGWIK